MFMDNIYILFDCPDESNDKKWLIDGLKKMCTGKVESISIQANLSLLKEQGVIGKVKAFYIMIEQAWRAIRMAKPGDAIITWNRISGLLVNTFLYKKKITLIAINWLTPLPKDKKIKRFLYALASNPSNYIIVNSPESPKKWYDFLKLSTMSRFRHIPDVYDTRYTFNYNFSIPKEKYCFTGGMNNRDWKLVVKLASRIPDYKFICVSLQDDFEEQTRGMQFPANLQVHYNIPSEQYYNLMNNAYLVLLPLRSKNVAGLINITRAAQGGVMTIITKTPAAQQYYSMECQDMLIDGDINHWQKKVEDILRMPPDIYQKKTKAFMQYIEVTFSPQKASQKILDIIQSAKS
jgi:glycosyltransferase involved in cell wall biosynthesis